MQIVLQQILTAQQMGAWGWRVPFVIGAIAAITVLYLRRSMDETEQFKAVQASAAADGASRRSLPGTGLVALMKYPRQLFAVLGLAIGGSAAFYLYTTYMQKYMVISGGVSKENAALISFVALFVFMLLQPVMGWISDKVGRKKPMLFRRLAPPVGTRWLR